MKVFPKVSRMSSPFAKVYPTKHGVEPYIRKFIHAKSSDLAILESLSSEKIFLISLLKFQNLKQTNILFG